jgi:hypothetical protein
MRWTRLGRCKVEAGTAQGNQEVRDESIMDTAHRRCCLLGVTISPGDGEAVMYDRQSERVAVCHDGLGSEKGLIGDKTTRNTISRGAGAGERGYSNKMAASDAIERMRAAPIEEKRGAAWSLEARQSAGLRGQSLGAMKIALQERGGITNKRLRQG